MRGSSPATRPFGLTCARLELSRQTGKDPALVGLLRVYKDYYPEIVVGDAVRGRASAFKVRRSSYGIELRVSSLLGPPGELTRSCA